MGNPDYNSLLELDEEVKIETEETLLSRNYCYWCKEGDKRETITVQKFIQRGLEQTNKYIKRLRTGNADHFSFFL